jgi:hypothetical protein
MRRILFCEFCGRPREDHFATETARSEIDGMVVESRFTFARPCAQMIDAMTEDMALEIVSGAQEADGDVAWN